jgi:hypothetical protein
MNAVKIQDNRWECQDGKDIIKILVTPEGLYVQRFSNHGIKGAIRHKMEILKWDKLIAKAEGQMLLF